MYKSLQEKKTPINTFRSFSSEIKVICKIVTIAIYSHCKDINLNFPEH